MINNDEGKFLYYKSGIYGADIILSEKEIVGRMKDIKDNKWLDYEVIDLKSNTYDPLLPQIWERFKELNNADFENCNQIQLECGSIYKKYIKVEDGWIWASQGEGLPIDILIFKNSLKAFIMASGDKCNILVKPGFEGYTPLKLWYDSELSKDIYGVDAIGTFYVKTRDGVKLATEVWLPGGLEADKKIPAILIRTPYNRLSNADKWFKFVRRGYALVIQDVRGN